MKKITVADIARITGKNQQCIRVACQQGVLPFGVAIQTGSKRFTYMFFPEKVKEYLGVDFENESEDVQADC